MAEQSPVYKICAKCGQSVSVAANFCPMCGTPFGNSQNLTQPGHAQVNANASPINMPGPVPAAPNPPPVKAVRAPAKKAPVKEISAEEKKGPTPMAGKSIGSEKPAGPSPLLIVIAVVLILAAAGSFVYSVLRLGRAEAEQPSDPMELAREAFEQGNYEDAVDYLELKLADGSADSEAYNLMAQSFTELGNNEHAAELYQRGYVTTGDESLKDSAIRTYLTLGDQALRDGDHIKARKYYNTVLTELDSGNLSAITGLAMMSETAVGPTRVSQAPENTEAKPETSPDESGIVETETSDESTDEPLEEASEETVSTVPDFMDTFEGRWYELSTDETDWYTASDTAFSKDGYLATLHSDDELTICITLAEKFGLRFVWLGATGFDCVNGIWANGEPFDYDLWLSAPPDDGEGLFVALVSVDGDWYYDAVSEVPAEYAGEAGYMIEYD